jgi:hypothetical protein
LAKPDISGQLQIQTTEIPHPGQGAQMYDVNGTLRRYASLRMTDVGTGARPKSPTAMTWIITPMTWRR